MTLRPQEWLIVMAVVVGAAGCSSAGAPQTQTATEAPPVYAGNAGQVSYAEDLPFANVALANAGVVDVVTDGGVDNTGQTDAACALQTLLSGPLEHSGVKYGTTAPWQDKIVFFRNGTYLLSNPACLPLVKNYSDGTPSYGMVLMGESQGGAVLRLAANTLPVVSVTGTLNGTSRDVTGLSSTAGLRFGQLVQGAGIAAGTTIASIGTGLITLSAKPTASGSAVPLTVTTPVILTQSVLQTFQGQQVQFGNEAFHNVIENLTLDLTAAGNSGATGISYLANNMGAVRNVTLLGDTGGSSQGSGIDMTRAQIGPAIIENVLVSGFARGVDVANAEYGITLEHMTFTGQRLGAIFNADNLVMANAIRVQSGASAVAVTNATANGFVILANSRFDQTGSALVANLSASGGAVSVTNTSFATAQANLGGLAGTINGRLQGQTWTAGSNLMLTLTDDTPVLPYDAAAQWSAAVSGMSAAWTDAVTTPVDATAGIRAALACRNNLGTTMYLPHGVYYISSPIEIPSYINRIVGMDSTIRILPSAASSFPSGTPMFRVTGSSVGSCPYSNTLIVERLAFDNTTTGLPGLYAVEADAPAAGLAARTLVLRDLYTFSVQRLNQMTNAGEVYLENVTGGGMTVNGPKQVMARQFNSEAPPLGTPRITNNGANVWVLGLKTEGPNAVLSATRGTTEIVGGYFYTAPGSTVLAQGTSCAQAGLPVGTASATPAAFQVATGARFEASFVEEVNPSGGQTAASQSYPFYVYANGTCVTGAGGTGASPFPALRRTATTLEPGESGFIVPQISASP